MTLNSPRTSLDKKRVFARPAGKEGGNRGSRENVGDRERETGRRKGGERKRDADEDTRQEGQLCPLSYSTAKEKKESLFPSSSLL